PPTNSPLSLHDALPIFDDAHAVDGRGVAVRLHVERALGVGREFHSYTGRESRMLELVHQTAQVLAVRVVAHRRGEPPHVGGGDRSEEHTSELQSLAYLV